MLDGVSLIRNWQTSRQTGGGSYCARRWLWADRQMFCVVNLVEAALKYQRNSGSAEQQWVQRGSGDWRCWRRAWAQQLLYRRQALLIWSQEVDDRKSWRLNSRNSEDPEGSRRDSGLIGPAALAPFPLPPWFLQQCPDSCQRCVAAGGVASLWPTVLPQERQTVRFCLHSDGLIWMKTSRNCHRTRRGCRRRRKASAGSEGKSRPGWFPKSSS